MTQKTVTRICSKCETNPVTSAHLIKRKMYYCSECWYRMPCNRRAQSYQQRKDYYHRYWNERQYRVAGRTFYAKTPAQKAQIVAYVRKRRTDYKEAQCRLAETPVRNAS